MKFEDLTTTKKGTVGEELVNIYLNKKGYIVYSPISDGAHPFDKLCASKDKRSIVIAEVKTKQARSYYPDTGFNIKHYHDYLHIQSKNKIPVFIYFVDEGKRQIYGNKLNQLKKERIIFHKGKMLSYPLEHGDQIYFPLESMISVCDIDDISAQKLVLLSTRNPVYDR